MSELLGADTEVLDRDAESLSADSRRVQDLRTLAHRAVTELQASWNGVDLAHLTRLWEEQASPLLAAASQSLDTCAARLRAQSAAQSLASRSDAGTRPVGPLPLRPAAAPPDHGSPAGNAAWWRSHRRIFARCSTPLLTRSPTASSPRHGR